MGAQKPMRHDAMPASGQRIALIASVACSLVAAAGHAAQTDVTFNASLTETVTDNVGADSRDEESRFVTSASAGASANLKGGFTSGNVGLQATSQFHHSDHERDTSYVTGSAQGNSELVRDVLFLDVGGSIRRTDASVFGLRSVDEAVDTGNRATVRNYYAMPSVRFRLGSHAQASASYRWNWSSGSGVINGTRLEESGNLGLGGRLSGAISWNLTYSRTRTDSNVTNSASESKNSRGRVSYAYSRHLTLSLTGGYEENNYRDGQEQSYYTRGAGFDWTLSPRTRFSAFVEKRFFGTGYSYSLSYGRPLSSVQITYSRDVSSIDSLSLLSLEDIAFREFFLGLASAIPDPVQREAQARALAGSIPNGSTTFTTILSERYAVSRRFSLAGTLIGARNSLSLALSRVDSERIGTPLGLSANDPLASFSRIVTSTAALSLSHSLSGKSNLALGLNFSEAEGQGDADASTRSSALTCSYRTRLGPSSNASLTVRRQRSTGDSEFTEHALIGSVSTNF